MSSIATQMRARHAGPAAVIMITSAATTDDQKHDNKNDQPKTNGRNYSHKGPPAITKRWCDAEDCGMNLIVTAIPGQTVPVTDAAAIAELPALYVDLVSPIKQNRGNNDCKRNPGDHTKADQKFRLASATAVDVTGSSHIWPAIASTISPKQHQQQKHGNKDKSDNGCGVHVGVSFLMLLSSVVRKTVSHFCFPRSFTQMGSEDFR